MGVSDVALVLLEIVRYCIPFAFMVNLTAWGARVVILACTGKGLNLDGRIK